MEVTVKGTRYSAFKKLSSTSATCIVDAPWGTALLQARWLDHELKDARYCELYKQAGDHFGATVRYQSIPLAVRRELKRAILEAA